MAQAQKTLIDCTELYHSYPVKKFGAACRCGQRVWGKKGPAAKPANPLEAPPEAPLENFSLDNEKILASQSHVDVGSSHLSETANEVGSRQDSEAATQTATTNQGDTKMTATLTYKGLSKSGKYALYSGLRTVTRLSVTNFPNSQPVPSFTAEGEFAGPREKKAPLTAEERKALRDSKPKLTLAEQIARDEARLAKRKAKLAAQAEQPVGASA